MESLTRAEIIAQSLASRSGIVLTPDLETAASLANEYAPEHLCLSVADPAALAPRIHNAGGLFFGEHSFEVLGDYVAGPSHVMPTGGTARFASPLNVLDFVKITSLIAWMRPPPASLARWQAVSPAPKGSPPTPLRRISALEAEMFDPQRLIRAHIQNMPAYEPIVPFEVLSQQLGRPADQIVKLDANENPYGLLPASLRPWPACPSPTSTPIRRAGRSAQRFGAITACRPKTCWLAPAPTS